MTLPALLTSLSSQAPYAWVKLTWPCCTEVNATLCVAVLALAAGDRNTAVPQAAAAAVMAAAAIRSFMMTSVPVNPCGITRQRYYGCSFSDNYCCLSDYDDSVLVVS